MRKGESSQEVAKGFSSPIFGDMFLLVKAVMMFEFNNDKFSSPIFGDMFLLRKSS